MELLDNGLWDFSEVVLGVEGEQLPGQSERVVEIPAFILTLCDKLMFKLLQEFEMVEVFFCECLCEKGFTSSPITAFMAAVSLAAA